MLLFRAKRIFCQIWLKASKKYYKLNTMTLLSYFGTPAIQYYILVLFCLPDASSTTSKLSFIRESTREYHKFYPLKYSHTYSLHYNIVAQNETKFYIFTATKKSMKPFYDGSRNEKLWATIIKLYFYILNVKGIFFEYMYYSTALFLLLCRTFFSFKKQIMSTILWLNFLT